MIGVALAFLGSAAGRWIAGAGVALIVLGGVYVKGHADGADHVQRKWDAANVAEQLRQVKAGNDALDAARRRADTAEVESEALQTKVDEYAAELAKRNPCVVPDADGERLRKWR